MMQSIIPAAFNTLPAPGAALATGKDVFMPEYAPLMALAFLGAAGGSILAVIALVVAAVIRKRRFAVWIAAVEGLGLAGYLGALGILSASSRERVLEVGDHKYFCELDCHIAYSLQGVRRVRSVGSPDRPVSASGEFTIVTLKTWFDEHSIGPARGNGPLTPNPRVVSIVDAAGQRFLPDARAQGALAAMGAPTTPLDRPLTPGQSYLTTLAFDLPADAREPRLVVTDAETFTHVLIGHENSLFHKKISFALRGAGTAGIASNRN